MTLIAMILCAALGIAREETEEPRERPSGLDEAPESAHTKANPYEGDGEAIRAGRKLFVRYCTECHGGDARGRRNAPALDSVMVQLAAPGDLFWFLTNGNLRAGMPSWSRLPDARRWQIVTFLKTLGASPEPRPFPRDRGMKKIRPRINSLRRLAPGSRDPRSAPLTLCGS
jgi:mono/diheme cytochrome c family protein